VIGYVVTAGLVVTVITFVKNYLYTRPGERAWRLAAMLFLVVMLVIAITPTGNYNWPNSWGADPREITPSPSDYAVYYMRRVPDADALTFTSMVFSVLLLTLGFASRAVRLHKTLSIYVIGQLRKAVSEKVRAWLRKLYDKCDVQSSSENPKRTLIYRPALALFLVMRVVSDVWSSMFVEVCSAFPLLPYSH